MYIYIYIYIYICIYKYVYIEARNQMEQSFTRWSDPLYHGRCWSLP